MGDVVTPTGAGSTTGDTPGPVERAFLIADVRGYTSFTRERGDAEAARLATRLAEVARDAVEARSGRVIELRGDEVLAVFASLDQAVRAAVELQAVCEEQVAADPTLPLLVGVGIDVGEAVPVEGGFRGAALNTAARLCSQAAAGQVLLTAQVADRAGVIAGVRFASAGTAELKGFDAPVRLMGVVAEPPPSLVIQPAEAPPLPIELELDTPLVGRESELAWLRGTWRQARRGYGRVVFVSGPAKAGKSLLVAELAGFAHSTGATVSYAGAGGTAVALAKASLRNALAARRPALVVLDDFGVTGEAVAPALTELVDAIETAPTLVVGIVREPDASPAVARLIDRVDPRGDGHRSLGPLDACGGASDRTAVCRSRRRRGAARVGRPRLGRPARAHSRVDERLGRAGGDKAAFRRRRVSGVGAPRAHRRPRVCEQHHRPQAGAALRRRREGGRGRPGRVSLQGPGLVRTGRRPTLLRSRAARRRAGGANGRGRPARRPGRLRQRQVISDRGRPAALAQCRPAAGERALALGRDPSRRAPARRSRFGVHLRLGGGRAARPGHRPVRGALHDVYERG